MTPARRAAWMAVWAADYEGNRRAGASPAMATSEAVTEADLALRELERLRPEVLRDDTTAPILEAMRNAAAALEQTDRWLAEAVELRDAIATLKGRWGVPL